jgi:hypothetical protein
MSSLKKDIKLLADPPLWEAGKFSCLIDMVLEFFRELHIQPNVQLWLLIKNDPQVVLISLTKIMHRAVKNWAQF